MMRIAIATTNLVECAKFMVSGIGSERKQSCQTTATATEIVRVICGLKNWSRIPNFEKMTQNVRLREKLIPMSG
jgi:hypothetical protein